MLPKSISTNNRGISAFGSKSACCQLHTFLAFVLLASMSFVTSCGNSDQHTVKQSSDENLIADQTAKKYNQQQSDRDIEATNFSNWDEVLTRARGQEVLFNAWGGSDVINNYFIWASELLAQQYGITLTHIKVGDIATSVTRILSEFTAGKRTSGGSVDLMWINGENFRSMKENNLVFGPFANFLPNIALLNPDNSALWTDFGVPTDGYESPLGSSQFVVVFDSERVIDPPQTIRELLMWAQENPGRFTYPKPPNYIGTTFLKHVLYEVIPNPQTLLLPVTDVAFDAIAPQLWDIVDSFHQVAWNGGRSFPANHQDQFRLLNDKEVDFAFSFSPGEASANIVEGTLPQSVRTMIFINGTIGNTHFVAIPANASAKEAAMVVANFLLSPEAQLRKQHPDYWGDYTILDSQRLDKATQAQFANIPFGIATLRPKDLFPTLDEPHASWVQKIEQAWQERYL